RRLRDARRAAPRRALRRPGVDGARRREGEGRGGRQGRGAAPAPGRDGASGPGAPRRADDAALRAALALLLLSTSAHADADWTLQLEAGSELDTNVHRAPSDTGSSLVGVDARVGARPGPRARPVENGLIGLNLVGAAKAFAGSEASNEDVALGAGDLRFDVAVGDRLTPGIRLSYYDAGDQGAAGLGVRTGDAAAALTLRTDG